MTEPYEVGTVYAKMVPPEDSFEAAHPDSWFPVWYRKADRFQAVRISFEEAKKHFEEMGQPMPDPIW